MRRSRSLAHLVVVGTICATPTACVKKSTHQAALADLASARVDIGSLEDRLASLEAEQESVREQMSAERERRDSVEAALRQALAAEQAERSRTEQQRQAAVERIGEGRREIDRLRTLLLQRGAEYESLQRRLESLEAVEREVRERNAIYEDVIARFRSLMDGGQLTVAIERGRLVILLPQDVLFESGSAILGREGQAVIAQVAGVLAEFPERRFQVEGHTDNVPIATSQFPSNWELSSARALAVVRLLTRSGVAPENVSGAAYGEHQPVASNDDRDSRRRNRRIEIVMLPNLDLIADTDVPGSR